jgi:aspartyl-tRNA(Asn)/glutamyl-tRNA(Gln) amidotransferase subunit A
VAERDYAFGNPNPTWMTLQQSNWAARFASAPAADRAKLSKTFNEGIDAGASYTGLDLHRALAKRTEFFRNIQAVFAEGVDFIVTPCASAPPVAADFDVAQPLMIDGQEVGDLRTEWTPYLSLFDLSGHPAIAMPCGRAANGGGLGLQLVAPWGKDAALLAAAAAYQTAPEIDAAA